MLTAAASATDAAIQKKNFGSRTMLLFPNEEIDDIIKIVKSIEDVGLLIRGVSETVENRVKKGRFLDMLAVILGASLLGNMLAAKGIIREGEGAIATSQGQGTYRAGQNF